MPDAYTRMEPFQGHKIQIAENAWRRIYCFLSFLGSLSLSSCVCAVCFALLIFHFDTDRIDIGLNWRNRV